MTKRKKKNRNLYTANPDYSLEIKHDKAVGAYAVTGTFFIEVFHKPNFIRRFFLWFLLGWKFIDYKNKKEG